MSEHDHARAAHDADEDAARPAFVDEPGDTPLRQVPSDYDGGGGRGRWFLLPEGPDAGRRLYTWERWIGHERPADAPVVLLVHGNPECSYTFRHVVSALAAAPPPRPVRVVAVDHLGFGRSDQARSEMVDVHHAAHLRMLVQALDLRDVTLVVHDWGGPIGIGALLAEPERVSNLLVLNSTVFPMPPDSPTYTDYPLPGPLAWSRTPVLVPDPLWGRLAAFVVELGPSSPVALAQGLARALLGPFHPSSAASRVFAGQFASTMNVRSSKRMVRQTPVWGHGYAYDDPHRGRQDNREFYAEIQRRLPEQWAHRLGAAGVFGAWDPLAKPSVLAQWRQALPQMRVQVLEGASHFVEEHRPVEIADALRALLERTASS